LMVCHIEDLAFVIDSATHLPAGDREEDLDPISEATCNVACAGLRVD
jgi:hypothetical protein